MSRTIHRRVQLAILLYACERDCRYDIEPVYEARALRTTCATATGALSRSRQRAPR